jgi:hypothetical protein
MGKAVAKPSSSTAQTKEAITLRSLVEKATEPTQLFKEAQVLLITVQTHCANLPESRSPGLESVSANGLAEGLSADYARLLHHIAVSYNVQGIDHSASPNDTEFLARMWDVMVKDLIAPTTVLSVCDDCAQLSSTPTLSQKKTKNKNHSPCQ